MARCLLLLAAGSWAHGPDAGLRPQAAKHSAYPIQSRCDNTAIRPAYEANILLIPQSELAPIKMSVDQVGLVGGFHVLVMLIGVGC